MIGLCNGEEAVLCCWVLSVLSMRVLGGVGEEAACF